ncbi:MAG: hypothetical protein ACJ8MR_13765 [Povalibacter sp.]
MPSLMGARGLTAIFPVLVFFSTCAPVSVAAACLRYGAVELTGKLVQQTYAGQPDYESVSKGDEALVIWILQLHQSVCIARAGSDYPGSYGTREFQLVLGADQYASGNEYASYRDLLGKKITVTGELVPGAARYQKRFVIVITTMERADNRSRDSTPTYLE